MNISSKHIVALSVLLAGAFAQTATAVEAKQEKWTVVGSGIMNMSVMAGETPRFTLHNNIVGPGWKGGRLNNLATVAENKRLYVEDKVSFYNEWWEKKPLPGCFDLRYVLEKSAPNAVRMTYALTPDMDMSLGSPKNPGQVSATIGPLLKAEPYFEKGTCTFVMADGKTEERAMPMAMSGWKDVASITLKTASGETTKLTFVPPLFIHCDHSELRMYAGNDKQFKAGAAFTQTIDISLPQTITFEPANRLVDTKDWFALDLDKVNDCVTPSVLGLDDWLDKPAGKHGWLKMKGKDFVFDDGAPGKFWGINICWSQVTSEKDVADQWADRCAKYGVNLVRFHKFINHMKSGTLMEDPHDGTKLNEEKAAKFDYFSAALAKRGVYYGWSQYYAYTLSPADKERVLAYDELMAKGSAWFKGTTIMLVNFAPDLQDLHIKTLQTLLNRVNTVTGKRYADDKALAYIEVQNEDDIFFYGLDQQVKACPTYYKLMKRQFADWLKNKYQTEDAWKKAWDGKTATEESFAAGNIDPFADNLNDASKKSPRWLDAYAYLYDAQTDYYKKVSKALRAAGYGGAICGSCWQTATFLGHLYNVRSDREVGFVDRHNYGGGEMLTRPGRGLLSAGMQQVADRPYNFSEWSGGTIYGGSEMVPMIGFIGMGIQGWDMSCHFASGTPRISVGVYPCDDFLQLAQYPAVARAVYRGDFVEGAPVATRRVSVPAMHTGEVGFNEEFSLLGGANIKEFSSAVRQEALGVGPVVLEFVDGPVATPVEDKSGAFVDSANKRLTSASGQVHWDYSGRGFFTVNTPGTQGLVGFGGGRSHQLKDVSIHAKNPLAFVYVSARGPKETIANAKSLIITAVGRVFRDGSVVDELTMETIKPGAEPEAAKPRVEPIQAVIELKGNKPCKVFALDHAGRKSGSAVELPVEKTGDGIRFTLDGVKYKTMHYLVEMK